MQASLFGQVMKVIEMVPPEQLRIPFGSRPFLITFRGEGSLDYGGPYREVLTLICKELMSDTLDLFVPVPNQRHELGDNREMFIPSPSASSVGSLALFRAFGKLLGVVLRSTDTLDLMLPSLFWKGLVGDERDLSDLAAIDQMAVRTLACVRDLDSASESFSYLIDERFETILSDGSRVELLPGGGRKRVKFENRLRWMELVIKARLHECDVQTEAIREGRTWGCFSCCLNVWGGLGDDVWLAFPLPLAAANIGADLSSSHISLLLFPSPLLL